MLQENASDNPDTPPLPMRAPDVGEATATMEAELTLRTKTILRAFMRAVHVTKQETEIDSLLRQVNVRFAYEQLGMNQLPMSYRPGFNYAHHLWWPVLKYQLVGLVYNYYIAIEDHNIGPYHHSATRLEEMLDKGIMMFLLSPAEPSGYVLRTNEEWKTIKDQKERRQVEILDNKDRIEQAREDERLDDDGAPVR